MTLSKKLQDRLDKDRAVISDAALRALRLAEQFESVEAKEFSLSLRALSGARSPNSVTKSEGERSAARTRLHRQK